VTEFRIIATPLQVRASAELDTVEQARQIAAAFPKSAGLKPTTLSTYVKDEYGEPVPDPIAGRRYQHITKGYIGFYVKLDADNANKGRNEAGIKRLRSLLRNIERLGHTYRYDADAYTNGMTADEFGELVAG
jgi:hypothetical protein